MALRISLMQNTQIRVYDNQTKNCCTGFYYLNGYAVVGTWRVYGKVQPSNLKCSLCTT